MTDVAVARLIQSGTLRLDTPLGRYLPSFPSADTITIEHLVSHRAGIAHTNRMEWRTTT